MRRIITWFVDNPVAANLLMAVLLIGGGLSLFSIRQEEFPSMDTEVVQVSVSHLGASPEEVEQAVCIRLEDAIDGTPHIDRVSTIAVEGTCVLNIELVEGTDSNWALSEIEGRISNVSTLPAEAEKPVVSYLVLLGDVLRIAISGDADERSLKVIGQTMRDEIAALPGVSQVELSYVRPYEISIEVSEQMLRRHGLNFEQVAAAVRSSSLDLPGGSVKTEGGEILLRSKGQAYRGAEFASIVVLTRSDGTSVNLGDIATVRDGFRDDDIRAFFDGKPAVMVQVNRIGEEDILEVAATVKAYVEQARTRMPEGIELTIWSDEAESLRDRVDALLRNASGGLAFVLLVLALLLRFRIAVWVAAGIPISMLGAVMLFPAFGYAISTLAIMGFILVLGIVVDDAIVVGESVYAHEQAGSELRTSVIDGTSAVSIPVIFGVLTTIAAFSPLIFVPGRMGQFFTVLGGTVILCLIMSLVEAQLILPAHLARRHKSSRSERRGRWAEIQDRVSGGFEAFVAGYYQPALEWVLHWRYLALSVALGVVVLTASLFASGRMAFQFFPGIEGDRIYATLTMPQGTPLETTEAAVRKIESAAEATRVKLEDESEGAMVRHVLSSIGKQVGRDGPRRSGEGGGGTHLAQVVVEIAPWNERDVKTREVTQVWRDLTGPITDAVELKFEAFTMHAGDAFGIQLSSDNAQDLEAAAQELRTALAGYEGVFDIADSFRPGKQEVRLSLLPEAEPLGITFNDLARQVRTAFYGVEVQRIQRGTDDVRVMLRYPEEERRSLGNLENMRIRTPDGTEIPIGAVARAELGRGFATIRRNNGKRVLKVTADIDRTTVTPEEIMKSVLTGPLPKILKKYPGLTHSLEGEQRERSKALTGLFRGAVLALLVIYTLLAIPLRSYVQPLVIMAAIPFGAVGAIIGHFIMGWNLVFFSLLGIVALAGVVVNDSLVLVDFINRERARGLVLSDAVRSAGMKRFRAVFLTSATTFTGLLPLIFSASEATYFVVPIAISLAFGVVAATAITLFLVPCGCLIVEDLTRFMRRSSRDTATSEQPASAT
ncbi:MAG: efflux RND transporter permease subunit [bacterium]|nr:efflux RND transporter permease subunit [bacterium]